MNMRLVHDAAMTITSAVVGQFRWDREEQMVEAFHELLSLITRGLEAYAISLARHEKRLGRGRQWDVDAAPIGSSGVGSIPAGSCERGVSDDSE